MLFFIKKFLQALFLPPSLLLILLITSFILILLKKKWGKILLLITIIFYYSLSITPVSQLLLHGLESKYQTIQSPTNEAKHIVVLGGGTINRFSSLPPSSRLNPSSTARILEGIRLFRQIEDGYLITSGGNRRQKTKEEDSCHQMKYLAIMLGVEEDRIIPICDSRDTSEEAKNLEKIIGDKPFFLVTSAFHMQRSILLFKRLGLNPIAAPGDFKAQRKEGNKYYDFLPSPNNLLNSTLAVKEYFGLVFYNLFK